MSYDAKILADSITEHGERLTTFEVTFPRIVLAEVNTHRMLSRNSASSRATPVAKKIAQIEVDPFIPAAFIKNQKGMQGAEALDDAMALEAEAWWRQGVTGALSVARALSGAGLHKALANRVLEPYAWHTAILSATDWSNFWHLRVNPDAQGEFRTAAEMMLALYEKHEPTLLGDDDWHLPLVSEEERDAALPGTPAEVHAADQRLVKISVARCARVSYLTHDGVRDQAEDLALYEKLVTGGHLSPLEHVARPMTTYERTRFEQIPHMWDGRVWIWAGQRTTHYLGNYDGWVQHRKLVPGEADILGYRARVEKDCEQMGAMCAAYEEKFKMQREIVCAAQDWRKEDMDREAEAHEETGRGLLDTLADAVDALNEWVKERAAERAGSFTCPTCGPHVKADEDGCCATCGADCKMEGA